MYWTVLLEDETGYSIKLLEVSSQIEFELSTNAIASTSRLLKYLDLYGDTVFNRLQMDDLIYDLNRLVETELVDQKMVMPIIYLAIRCKNDRHTYVRFAGE